MHVYFVENMCTALEGNSAGTWPNHNMEPFYVYVCLKKPLLSLYIEVECIKKLCAVHMYVCVCEGFFVSSIHSAKLYKIYLAICPPVIV